MSSSATVEIKCDYDQIGALLKGSEVESMLQEIADGIRSRCGDGYESDTKTMGTRVIASVSTGDYDAIEDNAENNTILKALQ